jgi:hypothetical protein
VATFSMADKRPFSQPLHYQTPVCATNELDCSLGADLPFRFLDLPSELRLMVYERISINVTHMVLQDLTYGPFASINLLSRTLPVALLATCRLVHTEASPVLQPKIALLRDTDRFSLIIDQMAYSTFAKPPENLCSIALERKNMLLQKQPILPPSDFRVHGVPIGHTHAAFRDIDEFTKSLAALTTTGFPTTTTITIRTHRSQSEILSERFCKTIKQPFMRRDLDALIPGQVRFCTQQRPQ